MEVTNCWFLDSHSSFQISLTFRWIAKSYVMLSARWLLIEWGQVGRNYDLWIHHFCEFERFFFDFFPSCKLKILSSHLKQSSQPSSFAIFFFFFISCPDGRLRESSATSVMHILQINKNSIELILFQWAQFFIFDQFLGSFSRVGIFCGEKNALDPHPSSFLQVKPQPMRSHSLPQPW